MPDYGHPLLFGAFITPDAGVPQRTVALARSIDTLGLDILGVQDHPYQPSFLDTWTFLCAVAAQTERVILFPDVVNLPLRPPAVLARSAATLDLLSDGRVEMGLGAGAFPRGIEALGGPVRSAGESVEALEEAIAVIRSLWTPGGPVRLRGQHYSLNGAQPGPFPPHLVGIWLGSYKPRMLALTGRIADGWIPSSMYAAPDELRTLAKIIDEAAEQAGRDPSDIRRWYNVTGSFASRQGGFLQGRPRVWVEQLTDLALTQGLSGFILAPGQAAEPDLTRFAEEVAPEVRQAVAAARDGVEPSVAQFDFPHAKGNASREGELDETTRPRAPKHPDATPTAIGQANAANLVRIHDHLRSEMEKVRGLIEQLAAGQTSLEAARSELNQMTMRQNYWSVGSFCASYCRVLTLHHTIEDQRMFPDLVHEDGELEPVIERLSEEHEIIAGVLNRLDEAFVALANDPEHLPEVRDRAEYLADILASHLDYEEEELLGPIARLSVQI